MKIGDAKDKIIKSCFSV